MKTRKTLIATCVALLFTSTVAIAKDKWDYHEGAWDNTRSYGKVVISQDSVQQWGPWEDFVEPAAGAPSIGFLGAGAGDRYLPNPQPIPPAGCGDGEWCGYIAVALDYKPRRHENRCHPSYLGQFEPADIALQFQPTEGPILWGGPWNEGGVNLILRSDIPEYGASAGMETGMVPVEFKGLQGWFEGGTSKCANPSISLEGGFDGFYYDPEASYWKWKAVNKYATMGILEAKLREYVSYSDGEGGYWDKTTVYAPFVAGQLTTLSDMASLNVGNVTAEYRGQTALAGGNVSMTVYFGSAQWEGTWNNGYGATGFTANGMVNGANFSSTGVDAHDVGSESRYSSISGTVRGSFYGPQAAAAGGVVDVTKTASGYSEARTLTPTATRYVDVFLANKVPLRD